MDFKTLSSVLCAVVLAASGAENTVTVPDVGYEITFPKTWTVKKDALAPGMFTARLGASGIESGVDNQQAANFKTVKEYVDFKFGKKKKEENVVMAQTKVGEREAYKVTHEIGGLVLVESYCFAAGTRVYCVWFEMAKREAGQHAKDIEAVLKSFKALPEK